MLSTLTAPKFLAALSSFAFFSHVFAAVDCNKDLDACVRLVIAETATFIEECGNAYPSSKVALDAAFMNWSVLKLQIPGVEEALDTKSEIRSSLSKAIGPYLKRIPSFEREIECISRLEMVRSPKPKLLGDSVRLPPNALSRYFR